MTTEQLQMAKAYYEKWCNEPVKAKWGAGDTFMDYAAELLAAAEELETWKKANGLLCDANAVLQKRIEEREKACAEMRLVLRGIVGDRQDVSELAGGSIAGEFDWYDCRAALHALSTDCGKGYVRVEELKPLMEALQRHHEWSVYQSKNNEIVYSGPLRASTEQALAHAQKLQEAAK